MGWEANNVFQVVIISGGLKSGLFLYAPGTAPGLGNGPLVSITEGSTDPFGNPVNSDIAAYSNSSAAYPDVRMTGGTVVFERTAVLFGTLSIDPAGNLQVGGATSFEMLVPLTWGLPTFTPDTAVQREAAAQLKLTDNGTGNKPRLRIVSTVSSATVSLFALQNPAATDLAIGIFVAGDTFNRLNIYADGTMKWGPGGATALDTQLARGSLPASLLLGDNGSGNKPQLQVTGTVTAAAQALAKLTTNTAGEAALSAFVSGEANSRVRLDSDTSLRTGPGGATPLDTLMQRLGPAVWGAAAANGIGLTGGATPAAVAGVPLLYGSTGLRARQLSPTGHDTILSGTRTDTTSTTVTAAAFTALTNLFTAQAAELSAGSVLEVDTEGIATWGSTQQTLLFGADVDSALFGLSSTVLATAFAASASINWEAKVRLRVQSGGVGGTASVMVAVTLSPVAGSRTVGDDVRLVRRTASVAFDTTVAHTIGLGCQWGSITGAPTITSDGSTYRRDGS